MLFAASVMMIGSHSARAVTSYTTYTPPVADLNDLDHHAAYMWTLTGVATAPTYTSASLTITKINNWDLNKNILFIHLFDSANVGLGSNILTSYDDAVGQPVTVLSDAFKYSNLVNSNPLEDPNNRNNILIGTYVDGAFSKKTTNQGYSYDSESSNPTEAVEVINISSKGGTSVDWSLPDVSKSFTAPASRQTNNLAQTITFNFTQSQLNTLNAYIDNGGSFSLGFDSDCHYFNEGISFTLGQALTPIPEGSALLPLVGVLMLVGGRQYLRRRPSVMQQA